MAHLPCDNCGGSTNSFGSWDTLIKVICKSCSEKMEEEKKKRDNYDSLNRLNNNIRNIDL